MRKIEQQMIDAINLNRKWVGGNTEVIPDSFGMTVKLHGNIIATAIKCDGGLLWSFTLAGWNTPTTRSRINALSLQFLSKRAVWNKGFVPHTTGNKEVDEKKWFQP